MEDTLKWTGERYLPGTDPKICGVEIHYEHLHRYAFASHLVKDKDVLDLACGEGYGSYKLSRAARSVIGIDIDSKAVDHAQCQYQCDNLRFMQGSILDVPIIGEKKFDVIICFEAMEHIEEHVKLLSEVKRLLRDDGMFIVSTPNKKVYTDDHSYHNPFHVKELYLEEFSDLLRTYFSNLGFFGQRVFTGSNIWRLYTDSENSKNFDFVIEADKEKFRFEAESNKIPLYFIAVASNVPLNDMMPEKSYMVDLSNTLQWVEIERAQGLAKRLADSQAPANQLAEMKRTVLWHLISKYDNEFVERVLPKKTRRRQLYSLVIKSLRILVNEGWSSLQRQYHERKRVKKMESAISAIRSRAVTERYHPGQWNGEEIVLPQPSGPVTVSIIIPVHNKYEYTYNCLKSILKNTNASYEVVIVDDASSDSTVELLKKVKNAVVIRNEANLGFVGSCNKGIAYSHGKYVLFLNNDTLVTESWLEPLLKAIERENVGAVGAKLIYPNGKLQEAGGIIRNDASGWNYGRGDDPERPEYNFVRKVDYCSGAALLVRKDLLDRCGGLDRRYEPAYYEDTDLCFTIRSLGYDVLYQPASTIVHFEGVTSGTDVNSGVKKYQDVNREKFLEKWQKVLSEDHYPPDSSNLFPARNRGAGKNILVIDHYVPTFDRDSGSYRMFNFLKILSELGHKVTFIGDNSERLEPYTSTLQQAGVEVVYEPYVASIEDYLSTNGHFFDIVMLSRAHVASKYINEVKRLCTNAKVIFDTVDLQFIREHRRAEVEHDKGIMEESVRLKEMELGLVAISDVTLVVSPVEREVLAREMRMADIEVLSNIHEVKGAEKPFSGRRDLMFVGGFIHTPNVDAVKWFVKDVFPLIKKEIPGVKFYVNGNEPSEDIKKLASSDIIVSGYVKDLGPYFEMCKVFVSPLRYGSGVKGKINQSMSYGLPVVTTSIGAEGMGLTDGKDALIADDPLKFAEKVVKLYRDEETWNTLSVNSIKNVREHYSYDLAREKIKEIIDSISLAEKK